MVHANLPLKFWGACIPAATHTINKLPTALLDQKTPYEMLFGKSPSYAALRVIGSLCYCLDTIATDEFAKKGRRCITIGYPPH